MRCIPIEVDQVNSISRLSSSDCFFATSILFPLSVGVSCRGDLDDFLVQTVSGSWEDVEPPQSFRTLGEALRECDQRMMRSHRLAQSLLPEVLLEDIP